CWIMSMQCLSGAIQKTLTGTKLEYDKLIPIITKEDKYIMNPISVQVICLEDYIPYEVGNL
ncbi:Hypothetical predicted protein, partial [Pelobates cultripes]